MSLSSWNKACKKPFHEKIIKSWFEQDKREKREIGNDSLQL